MYRHLFIDFFSYEFLFVVTLVSLRNGASNNCKSDGGTGQECNLQNDFVAALTGSGNTCSGVEVSATAIPNGCGCQPSSTSPCTYDSSLQDLEDKCFFCTARDFAEVGTEFGHNKCDMCNACLVTTDARQTIWHRFKADDFLWSNGEKIYSLARCFEVASGIAIQNGNGLTWLKRILPRINAFEDCLGNLREPKSTDDWISTRTQCSPVCIIYTFKCLHQLCQRDSVMVRK